MTATPQRSLAIGDDIDLVGYHDISLSQRLPVPLTSERTPFDLLAATAPDLMLGPTADPIRRALPALIPRPFSGLHRASAESLR